MKFFLAFIAAVAVANAYVPKLDGRIVGGKDVNIRDYPYQVSVRYGDQHICGGSIIKADIILTAGHCVYDMDHSMYSIRVGDTYHYLGKEHIVSEVRLHSSYNPKTINYDMAILKLEKPITFNSNTQPIELQSYLDEVSRGTTSWVSGWGVIREGSASTPATLRAVDVVVLASNDCDKMYGYGTITSHMMCAQTIGHDSCQGDSGGPLAAKGKLIGVVSWGYGCAQPAYPGVYAKVSDMNPWVNAHSY